MLLRPLLMLCRIPLPTSRLALMLPPAQPAYPPALPTTLHHALMLPLTQPPAPPMTLRHALMQPLTQQPAHPTTLLLAPMHPHTQQPAHPTISNHVPMHPLAQRPTLPTISNHVPTQRLAQLPTLPTISNRVPMRPPARPLTLRRGPLSPHLNTLRRRLFFTAKSRSAQSWYAKYFKPCACSSDGSALGAKSSAKPPRARRLRPAPGPSRCRRPTGL